MRRFIALLMLVFLALAGCTTMRKWFVPVDVSRLEVGQTEAEVRRFCRFPDAVNTTVVDGLRMQQWVYREAAQLAQKDVYLYFYNGRLRSWQY